MPTGYTAKIHDGKEVSAREFIMDCSRAFGALVMMRDASTDAEIPQRFEPSNYAKEKADFLKERLAREQSLTEQEVMEEMEAWYRDKCEREFKHYQQTVELAERYNRTLEQVELWNPPTDDHKELKNFSMKQLRESLERDCYKAFQPYVVPEKPNLDTWIADRIEGFKSEISYYEKEHHEELQRTSTRNTWLRQLRESLEVLPEAIETTE